MSYCTKKIKLCVIMYHGECFQLEHGHNGWGYLDGRGTTGSTW